MYFILARKVRAKDTGEGVEQEKVVFYSRKKKKEPRIQNKVWSKRRLYFILAKNSKSQGYKRSCGARERLILF